MALLLPADPLERLSEHRDRVALTFQRLDELHDINLARDSSAGAICAFIGTTRDNFEGKTVTQLEYEAYPSMALKTMLKIVQEARRLTEEGAFSFSWPSYPEPHDCKHSHPRTAPPAETGLIPQSHSQAPQHAVQLTRISLVHRLGVVPPKETSISIVVSSPHRKEAFRACEWILEEVKKRVEVWKREVYGIQTPVDGQSASAAGASGAWKENFPA